MKKLSRSQSLSFLPTLTRKLRNYSSCAELVFGDEAAVEKFEVEAAGAHRERTIVARGSLPRRP